MNHLLKMADLTARKKFRYVGETKDEWRSHAAEARAGEAWTGDCDDLASTVCHIAIEDGFAKDHLWFAMVSSRGNKTVDHLVAIGLAEGDHYVVGDTFSVPYRLKSMQHRLLFVHRLDWPEWKWKRASGDKDLRS